ncbi:MAG: hypothetical protein LBU66_07895 [Treponema sp.]|jgi:ABC-type Fe3+ transport system permease subunit|nr:hypothetical protein [Treponema sp.]
MIYLGVLIGIGIISAMIYLALNKKSNFQTRVASLAALALMFLTTVICLFIVFTDNRVPQDVSVLIVGAPPEVVEKGGNNATGLVFLVIFLIAIFFLISYLSMRENRKTNNQKSVENNKSSSSNFDY